MAASVTLAPSTVPSLPPPSSVVSGHRSSTASTVATLARLKRSFGPPRPWLPVGLARSRATRHTAATPSVPWPPHTCWACACRATRLRRGLLHNSQPSRVALPVGTTSLSTRATRTGRARLGLSSRASLTDRKRRLTGARRASTRWGWSGTYCAVRRTTGEAAATSRARLETCTTRATLCQALLSHTSCSHRQTGHLGHRTPRRSTPGPRPGTSC
mmetsp:Transcript_4407/g.14273  ORF Transcript_4407/g.14273 Transcript_4407/m.14273 type:complete len:215 (-) Transcript_4407:409-1053(-)